MVEEQVLAQAQDLTTADCSIEVVCDLDRFNALAPEWDRLVEGQGADHVFLSHAWFRTWWESFGAGNELFVVTVRDRGKLRAIAPLMRTRASIYGLKVNTIHAIYNPHTPRYDFAIGCNRNPRFYSAIWSKLVECAQADAIVLTQIPQDSPTIGMMERLGLLNFSQETPFP